MRITLYSLMLLFIFLIGCSGSGVNQNPVEPDSPSDYETTGVIPVIGLSSLEEESSALGVMGNFTLSINPMDMTYDLVPIRTSSLGESYIVSGTAFFTMTPCASCLRIEKMGLNADGNVILGFNVKHPFPKGDTLKPPSASNRLDLDVFDLALVIKPVDLTPNSYPSIGVQTFPGIVLNADGYTGELSSVLTESSLLPYKICYEDPDNNRFEMGTDYQSFDVVIAPGSGLEFELWLTMGYGASARKPERLIPTYYIPEFNRKAAWKVEVTPPEGDDPPDINNTWNDSDNTTEFPVNIDIYDWNHGAVIADPYPDELNTDQISASSDVSQVMVEIPGMISAAVEASTTDTTQNGWDDPLTYTAMIANTNLLGEGTYHGLVKVADSRAPGISTVGGETDTLVHTENGILLQWFTMPEFSAYQVFPVTVVAGGVPPVCDINVDPPTAGQGETVYADPGASSDPDGSITMYEYDMDYDGVTFVADESQVSSDPDFGDPVGLLLPCNTTGSDIQVTVAIRVSDDNIPPLTSICTTEVTVTSKMGSPRKVTADTVNRGEGGANAYRITSIDLEWPDNPCAVEYLIERANNALNPTSWTALDTATTNFYKFQPTDLIGTDRLRVIARAVAGGNPLSDSDPSGEVLFIFDSHYTSNGHSWIERNEHYTGSHWNFNTSTYGFTSLDDVGYGGYGMASFDWICGYGICGSWPDNWCAWLTLVPDIVDQDAAYVDMYYHQNYYWDFGTTAAFVLGTSTGDMQNNASLACDMIPTQDHRDFTPYNNPCEAIDTEFCETGMYGFTGNLSWTHTSYWLNDLLDDGDRDYFVMAWANGSMSGGNGNGYNDAQVIVVY